MDVSPPKSFRRLPNIVLADGEAPIFAAGDRIKVAVRFPVGHFRVPNYIRGKQGVIEAVIPRPGINNEEEGFGRNAVFFKAPRGPAAESTY
jgi:nitrile hydratase